MILNVFLMFVFQIDSFRDDFFTERKERERLQSQKDKMKREHEVAQSRIASLQEQVGTRKAVWLHMQVISSSFYACAKQMFTSVFTNKYSDTSLRIVSFSRFLFITCTRDKTFSEEIDERRRDIPADDSSIRLVFRHLARRIVYTEQRTSCNFIRKVF